MEGKELYKAFKAALALKGMTLGEFARQLGVSRRFVLYVLRGQRPSKRVEKAILDFVENTLGAVYEKAEW